MYRAEVIKADGTGCGVRVVSGEKEYGNAVRLTMAVSPTKTPTVYESGFSKRLRRSAATVSSLYSQEQQRKKGISTGPCGTNYYQCGVKQSFSAYHPSLEEPVSFRETRNRQF